MVADYLYFFLLCGVLYIRNMEPTSQVAINEKPPRAACQFTDRKGHPCKTLCRGGLCGAHKQYKLCTLGCGNWASTPSGCCISCGRPGAVVPAAPAAVAAMNEVAAGPRVVAAIAAVPVAAPKPTLEEFQGDPGPTTARHRKAANLTACIETIMTLTEAASALLDELELRVPDSELFLEDE